MNGFKKRTQETDYLSLSAVDEDFVIINQYIKYLKYGFSRTTDIVNELIRIGDLDRNSGINIVLKYDGYIPIQQVKRFSSFISVSEQEVWRVINQNVNKNLFKIVDGLPVPKFSVGKNID